MILVQNNFSVKPKLDYEIKCKKFKVNTSLFSISIMTIEGNVVFKWFKFTLKPPYSIARSKLRLAIWDTSFWTFCLKFGHKGP